MIIGEFKLAARHSFFNAAGIRPNASNASKSGHATGKPLLVAWT
jgi:hypothetical protein